MVLKKIFLLLLFFFCLNVHAGPNDLGYMEVEVNSRTGLIYTSLELNPALLKTQNYFHETLGRSLWRAGNDKCSWRDMRSDLIAPNLLRITSKGVCPGLASQERLSLELRLLENTGPQFKIIGRIKGDDFESTFILNKQNHFIKIVPELKADMFAFSLFGVETLGISPASWSDENELHFPFGINHLLLILLIVVSATSTLEAISMLGGFTFCLALTLALLSIKGVGISPQVIDPMMILTIVFFALDIAFWKPGIRRFFLCLIFGSIHGLKMAEKIITFNLPASLLPKALVGFLLGIILAQFIVTTIMTLLLKGVKKYSFTRLPVTQAIATLIALMGSFWLFQKTMAIFT